MKRKHAVYLVLAMALLTALVSAATAKGETSRPLFAPSRLCVIFFLVLFLGDSEQAATSK